jgi:membrane-associated protease RseP (regulator of RpoE activity)
MIHRFLLCTFLLTLVASAQPAELNEESSSNRMGASWDWSYDAEEGGASSYLGVDIADVSPERLGELKLKEEHGAEVTMVDQDAPAGKAGLHEHDVIVSLNGAAVESAAQLRRMIRETPPGRVVSLGISRDGQPLTIKVQLADRHKSTGWDQNGKFEMPKMPKMPDLPDFDLPVSVVVVHSGMRSGLMVENLSPQLGEFFGVKSGKGVLVRSVEKGSRGEKAGFRAGDVVVKVNNQPVHDSSDFTHALRSSSGGAASVTVMREKKEQTLTLTLPEKKDSGTLQEESFDCPEFSLETEQAINRAEEEVLARVGPAIMQKAQQALRSSDMDLRHLDKKLQDFQQKMEERQQRMQERHHRLRHELSGDWAEI